MIYHLSALMLFGQRSTEERYICVENMCNKEVDVMYSQMVWREMEKDFEETEALEAVIEEE